MNVLIIGEYFPPDLGGAATRASNVAKGLSLNGCNVTVVTAFPHYPTGKIPKEYKHKLLKVEYVGKSRVIRTFVLPLESKGFFNRLLLFGSFMLSSLFALPIVGKIDVIWAANPNVLVLVPSIAYGSVKRKHIVSNVDDLVLEDLYDLNFVQKGSAISRLVEFCAKVLFAKIKAVTPISPGYIEPISKEYCVDENRIHVVRSGVDLSIFVMDQARCQDKERFNILYVGVLGVGYDFDQIINAAEIVAKSDSNIQFIIHGAGESAQYLKDTIKNRKLPNLTLIDRILSSRKEVVDLMNTADVLILPMKSFGRPYLGIATKLYEYQAIGKPIICCGDGEQAKYIEETNSGIVVKPGDYKAIASTVIYLSKNPNLANRLGKNGRNYVVNKLSLNAIGLEMKVILKNLTNT